MASKWAGSIPLTTPSTSKVSFLFGGFFLSIYQQILDQLRNLDIKKYMLIYYSTHFSYH